MDMNLEFVVLGSGSFAPAPVGKPGAVRNPSGYALVRGGETILFDLGFGNLRQLFRAGIDPRSVTHAFFSHRHPDHIGDLPALLFHFRYAGRPSGGRLSLYGPRGFSGFFARLTRAHHPWLRPRGYKLSVSDLEEGALVPGKGWRVRVFEVPHSTEAVAYRFESGTKSLCYSGDTGHDPGLALFARGADLFVLECSLPDRRRHAHHLRVSEALSLFKASGARRGLMTHLSEASARDLARRIEGTGARMAADLMRVRI